MRGLGCNSMLLSMLPIEQAIDLLAELGYQAIDISLEVAPPFLPPPPPHMSPEVDASTRTRVRRCAEKAGVTIAALNAHTNLIDGVPEKRQTNREFVRCSLQLASDLGAPYVVVGGGRKQFYARESQYWDWLVTSLRELAAEANRLGVTLAVEAGSFPGSLVHNTRRMQKLLSYDGLQRVGVVFDPAHYHVRGDLVAEAYRALSRRVVHVHAKDARGSPEDFEFPPLGEGDIDFEGLITVMRAADYSGFLAVEYEAFAWGHGNDARRVLRESKAFLERVLSSRSR